MFSESSFSDKDKQYEFIKKIMSIQTDLKLSKSLAFAEGNKPNLYALQSEYNQSAYHSLQAIEKTLKLIISANGEEYAKDHRISNLMVVIDDKYQQDFIDTHQFLWKNRKHLTLLNEARYDDVEVTKALVFVLYKEAEALAKEVEDKFKNITHLSEKHLTKIKSHMLPDKDNVVICDLLSSEYYMSPKKRDKKNNPRQKKYNVEKD